MFISIDQLKKQHQNMFFIVYIFLFYSISLQLQDI